MADDQRQVQDTRSETQKQYGSFYTKDTQEEIEVKRLKERLFGTTAQIYDPNAPIEDIKFDVIGTLEEVRQFMFGYKDEIENKIPSKDLLDRIKNAIDIIRLEELDREAINEIYQDIREPITFTLTAVLGFRKKKIMNYGWVEKLRERTQLPKNKATEEIIKNSRNKKKIN